MANIKIDSELMYHMIAAEPITSTKRFTAVRDESHRPLLFSISSVGQFVAIKCDGQGSNVLVDLSEILGLRQTADAFVVTQSSGASGLLFIAFSTKNTANSSHVHVLKPIKPSDLDLSPDELRSKLLFPVQQPSNVRISQLHMNPTTDDTPPLLVAIFHDINDDLQISRIAVTASNWTWKTDIRIPELAKSFIALSPGKLALGDGLFVLYRAGHGKPALMFITTDDPEDTTTIDLGFPADAEPTSMSTFTDGKGFTGIFIAGKGLFLLTAKGCLRSGNLATKISQDPVYHDVENLYIAQSGSSISAWFETEDHSLGYQRASNDGKLVGAPVLLLPAGSNAEYAPIIDPKSTSQMLVILDDNNQLSLLEQSIDSLMWTRTPFLVQRTEKMSEISAFVTHIEVHDADNTPLCMTPFTLSSSAWVNVLINGVSRTIPAKGTPVKTDARGIITLIVPSQDMSCYTFTLRDAADCSYLPADGVVIDPSIKVAQRLSTIKTAKDLKEFKSGNGKLLLDGCNASESDIKSAAEAIGAISNVTFSHSNPPQGVVRSHAPLIMSQIVHASNATFGSAVGSVVEDVTSVLWDAWEWVAQQVDKATNWILSQVEDAWHFIVTIAGKAWSFILDGVNAVVKAAGFIFSKLKVAFDAIVDAFGFIFNWSDIKDTRDSIKTMINSAFDFGSAFILNHKSSVEEVFDNLEKSIRKGLDLDIPDDVKNKKQSAADSAQPGAPEKSDASTSAPANVGAYHFEQAKNSTSQLSKATDAITKAFDSIIKPLTQEIVAKSETMTKDLVKLFKGKDGVSLSDVLKVFGAGILSLILGIVRSLVTGLMGMASDIIQGIKAILNWNVRIPVVTPLLEWLGVPAFSLLDAVSLILAMPVTVLAKAITGKAPVRIQTFDYHAMVEGRLDQPSLLAYNDLASYLTITYSIYDTITKVFDIMFSTFADPPEVFSLGSLVMKLIVQAATFPYDKESPGREYRIGIWSMLTANELIKSVSLQTGLPVKKLIAATDIFIALSTFFLTQVVHTNEYKENKSAADHAKTSLSLAESIYGVVSGVAGGYGTLVPDPVQKTICAAVVAASNANSAAIATGAKVLDKSSK